MTEFAETKLRHYCRFDRCKLQTPTSNLHEACARGCYRSFHLKRCDVCEKPLEQRYRKLKRGDRTKFAKVQNPGPTCGAPECKRRWRDGDGLGQFWPGRYQGSQKNDLRSDVPANGPLFSAIQTPKSARRWVIVAGTISPDALHCATVPDGPGCQWEGGSFERIEADNRRSLKAHFARLGADAAIQRHHLPVNIQGGYRPKYRVLKIAAEKTLEEIRNRVASGVPFDDPDAEQWKLPDPIIPGIGYDRQPKLPKQQLTPLPILDDLSIPDFLRR